MNIHMFSYNSDSPLSLRETEVGHRKSEQTRTSKRLRFLLSDDEEEENRKDHGIHDIY